MSADLVTTAFLYMSIATASGALAFLAGQRASGRARPEVEQAYEQALLLDSLAKDLAALCDDAEKSALEAESRDLLQGARSQVDEAILGLRRGADAAL